MAYDTQSIYARSQCKSYITLHAMITVPTPPPQVIRWHPLDPQLTVSFLGGGRDGPDTRRRACLGEVLVLDRRVPTVADSKFNCLGCTWKIKVKRDCSQSRTQQNGSGSVAPACQREPVRSIGGTQSGSDTADGSSMGLCMRATQAARAWGTEEHGRQRLRRIPSQG